MKTLDVRSLSMDELIKAEKDLKEKLFHLRFQLAVNQLENPMRIRAVKKDIARVKTVIREIEIKEQNEKEQVRED